MDNNEQSTTLDSAPADGQTQHAKAALRREAVTTIVLTIVLLLVGTAIATGLSWGGSLSLSDSLSGLPALLGWKVPIWIALVIAISVKFSAHTPQQRAWFATIASGLAVILGILIVHAPSLATMGGGLVLWFFFWGTEFLAFVACAAIGSFAAVALMARTRTPARVSTIVVAALLAVGGALALALLVQWFDVYFTLWTSPVVTDADGTRYLWTAGSALVLLLAAVVIAAIRRLRALGIIGRILLVIALVFAFVLQVPEGRWIPQPEPTQSDRDYVPCFGEGDPNCVGG